MKFPILVVRNKMEISNEKVMVVMNLEGIENGNVDIRPNETKIVISKF